MRFQSNSVCEVQYKQGTFSEKPEAASCIGYKEKLRKDDGSCIREHSFGMFRRMLFNGEMCVCTQGELKQSNFQRDNILLFYRELFYFKKLLEARLFRKDRERASRRPSQETDRRALYKPRKCQTQQVTCIQKLKGAQEGSNRSEKLKYFREEAAGDQKGRLLVKQTWLNTFVGGSLIELEAELTVTLFVVYMIKLQLNRREINWIQI